MIVKKLFASENTPWDFTVQTTDGNFYRFSAIPSRHITENDLTPLPYFRPIGRNGKEADATLYRFYGLQKQ